MGLDGVELVMAIEEKFGVSISDPEAEKVLTVGDMRRMVHSKLTVTDESTCLTQQAFHLIRRHAIQLFDVQRRAVTPDAFFADIVPKEKSSPNLSVDCCSSGFLVVMASARRA
jgi:hypothetical protein